MVTKVSRATRQVTRCAGRVLVHGLRGRVGMMLLVEVMGFSEWSDDPALDQMILSGPP